ncbi:MAG: SGNH/GDSL hydrolase family protein [Planctomycetaceae bacterium]|nr:SGNH/GDSL hydrolase family protein [Planctomycetaceae bacterium]
MKHGSVSVACLGIAVVLQATATAQEETAAETSTAWRYDTELLRPFWVGEVVRGESVLFIRDAESGEARGPLLFSVRRVLEVTCSSDWRVPGGVVFEEGRDYRCEPGSREIVLPRGSRIPSFTEKDLRRPAGSQQYRLTHRDGDGEILFGAASEYHEMQVSVTYQRDDEPWPAAGSEFREAALPRTLQKLREHQPVSIALLGDSISTGCNASGWANCSPRQPAYQDLLAEHLRQVYAADVRLTNLAVGGTSTPWGVTRIPDVVAAKPDLVILAFGMNDSSGRPAAEYKANIQAMILKTRESLPDTEFILVATMLGNRDWVLLKQELFPQYRAALQELTGPGIALADLTSVWGELLKRKRDSDLTGNGVNHPNDFGHRIYAQVISSLLVPQETERGVNRNRKQR